MRLNFPYRLTGEYEKFTENPDYCAEVIKSVEGELKKRPLSGGHLLLCVVSARALPQQRALKTAQLDPSAISESELSAQPR